MARFLWVVAVKGSHSDWSTNYFHYNHPTWTSCHLKPTATWLFLSGNVYSGKRNRKHQNSALLTPCEGIPPVSDKFPSQKTNNAESSSVSWRYFIIWFTHRNTMLSHYIPTTVSYFCAKKSVWFYLKLDFLAFYRDLEWFWRRFKYRLREEKSSLLVRGATAYVFTSKLWKKSNPVGLGDTWWIAWFCYHYFR